MNGLQKVGAVGSMVCVIVAVIGYRFYEEEQFRHQHGMGSITLGVGIVGILVCLLVFAAGRYQAEAEKEREARMEKMYAMHQQVKRIN